MDSDSQILMPASADAPTKPVENNQPISPVPTPDRRADVEAKQDQVAELLREVGCDALLVFEPENFSWLTSGCGCPGILDPAARPALYFNAEQRWLLCANVDTQRLFDEEIDGLGFQVKEWPWHWSRAQLVADLVNGRKVACDRPEGDLILVADQLQKRRLSLSIYEMACYRVLGEILSHAIEASCRTMVRKQTEREVAGQVSHRLWNRNAEPVSVMIAADGRSARYRRGGCTPAPVYRYCVITATARKYGLYTTASRAVCFGDPDPAFKKEFDAASRVTANFIACSWPDAVPREVFNSGRRVYKVCGFEYEWLLCPPGHITGLRAVELPLGPQSEELFQPGWAVTWLATVGRAASCDTILITKNGPKIATPTENWPLKRVRIQGSTLVRPDLLVRES